MDTSSKTSQTVDKITESFVKSVALTERGQLLILEKFHPRFGLLIGTRGKTFVAQCKLKVAGKWTTRRRKLGSPDNMSVKSARQHASTTIIELRNKITEPTGEYTPT